MEAHKINIKFYLEDGMDTDPQTWFETFNTWIPDTPDEVLVDVADYSHVHNGPVTLLVGHDANYSIDNTDGRCGLLYDRKRPLEGSPAQQIGAALIRAVAACQRIEGEPALRGSVRFQGGEFLLVLNDRLLAPNTHETLEAFKKHLDSVLKLLYSGSTYSIEHITDPKGRFALQVKSQAAPQMDKLMENLDGVF
jgi:hypothetical protein